MARLPIAVALLSLSLLACKKSPSEGAPPPAPAPTQAPSAAPSPAAATATVDKPGAPNAGGLVWTAPAPFEARVPESRMRAAEYIVTAEGGGEPAVMGIFFFGVGQGGSVDANVDRWVGQFVDPKGRPIQKVAKINKRTINGMNVTVVDVTGTYASGMPGASSGPQENQRMLSAIVEGPNGPVFFKFVGPVPAVERAESGFEELLQSIKPGP